MKNAPRRISPATVLASLALFISLGGVSYGVATGSIDSREIQNNSVQSRDVRDGGLQGRDIANGALLGRDIANGGVLGRDIASNALGDREVDEPQLDINRLGGIRANRYVHSVVRVQRSTPNDATTPKAAPLARCPAGKRIVGGGARIVAPAPVPVALSANGPAGKAWVASAYATAPTGNWQLISVAVCG
jgi:hypothetical protein